MRGRCGVCSYEGMGICVNRGEGGNFLKGEKVEGGLKGRGREGGAHRETGCEELEVLFWRASEGVDPGCNVCL